MSGRLSAVAVIGSRDGAYRPDRGAAIAALIWTCACAAYRLFVNDGRSKTVRAVRPMAVALGLVEAFQLAFIAGVPGFEPAEIAGLAAEISALLRALVGIGALVLLHNLLAGAADS